MSATAVINHARRAKAQRTAEEKLNALADAVESLARLIGELQSSVGSIESLVRRAR